MLSESVRSVRVHSGASGEWICEERRQSVCKDASIGSRVSCVSVTGYVPLSGVSAEAAAQAKLCISREIGWHHGLTVP